MNEGNSPSLSGISATDPSPLETEISVVIPLFNEQDNIEALLNSLLPIMDRLDLRYEIICVDDGSMDASFDRLQAIASEAPGIVAVRLARNFGQTAAIMAGVEHATGSIIVTMDGDGQNDPADIPNLLAKLNEGYDVVSGWRFERKDRKDRVFISHVANSIISRVSGVVLRDYGCTLKAYRRDVLANVRLYGELHRFIPIFSYWEGGRITEIKVSHHPRRHGKSKYGYGRAVKVVLDLLLVRYLHRYMHRPLHLFGGVGVIFLLGAACAGFYALWLKFIEGSSFIDTPLPVITTVLSAIGVLSILMGFLAEIIVRTYYESQGRRPYLVRQVFPEQTSAHVRD
jgi:glycosyltransferase involved in cell wall biosynthesis